jgi:hypothetical protein
MDFGMAHKPVTDDLGYKRMLFQKRDFAAGKGATSPPSSALRVQ